MAAEMNGFDEDESRCQQRSGQTDLQVIILFMLFGKDC